MSLGGSEKGDDGAEPIRSLGGGWGWAVWLEPVRQGRGAQAGCTLAHCTNRRARERSLAQSCQGGWGRPSNLSPSCPATGCFIR